MELEGLFGRALDAFLATVSNFTFGVIVVLVEVVVVVAGAAVVVESTLASVGTSSVALEVSVVINKVDALLSLLLSVEVDG